jgi:hypothetical protein
MPRSLGTPRCYFFFLAGAFLAAFFAAFLVAFFIDRFSVTSKLCDPQRPHCDFVINCLPLKVKKKMHCAKERVGRAKAVFAKKHPHSFLFLRFGGPWLLIPASLAR